MKTLLALSALLSALYGSIDKEPLEPTNGAIEAYHSQIEAQ